MLFVVKRILLLWAVLSPVAYPFVHPAIVPVQRTLAVAQHVFALGMTKGEQSDQLRHIVVIDSFTADQGQLKWGLDDFNYDVYPRTAAADTVRRIGNADIVFTNKVIIDDDVMEACPKLAYIGVTATGYNVVDLDAARRRKIAVTNIPAYSTPSVVQMVMAYLLHDAVGLHNHLANAKQWPSSPDFCYLPSTPPPSSSSSPPPPATPQQQSLTSRTTTAPDTYKELSGKTLVILGSGTIGQAVAAVTEALGMNVIFAQLLHRKHRPPPPSGGEVKRLPLDDALTMADYVSLHVPLAKETENIVNQRFLEKLKRGAVLINASRGPLLDEGAVVAALDSGTLRHVYVDVMRTEPPAATSAFFNHRDVSVTAHIAWATVESRQRLIDIACENVRAWLRGETLNRVDLS